MSRLDVSRQLGAPPETFTRDTFWGLQQYGTVFEQVGEIWRELAPPPLGADEEAWVYPNSLGDSVVILYVNDDEVARVFWWDT